MDLISLLIGAAIGVAVVYAFSRGGRNHNPEHQRQANEIGNRLQKWDIPIFQGLFEELSQGNRKGVFRVLRPLHRVLTDEESTREAIFKVLKAWLAKFLKMGEAYEGPLMEIFNEHLAVKRAREVASPTRQVVNGVQMIGPTDASNRP
jgi:hypothetical protein